MIKVCGWKKILSKLKSVTSVKVDVNHISICCTVEYIDTRYKKDNVNIRAVFYVGSLVVLAVDMEFCLNNQGVCPMYLALC